MIKCTLGMHARNYGLYHIDNLQSSKRLYDAPDADRDAFAEQLWAKQHSDMEISGRGHYIAV